VDNNRRNFLKIILIGGGTFIAGKVLGPLFSNSLINPPAKDKSSAFKIVEDKKVLSIYDNSGEEIFQIDKES